MANRDTTLFMKRDDAIKKLNNRIILGNQLLYTVVVTEAELKLEYSEYNKWNKYNNLLLTKMFSDDSLFKEYNTSIPILFIASSLKERIKVHFNNVETKIQRLEYIVEILELIDEATDIYTVDTNQEEDSKLTTKLTEEVKYSISYYGADFPVDALVKRMEREDFIVPDFQRNYVWNSKEASQFIESLLLGFPVPSLFLAQDKVTDKYIIIDGQQRLKTILYFYTELFPNGKKFKLTGVIPKLEGMTYNSLAPENKRALDNTIIHAIIINEGNETNAMFHLFERINTTGSPLTSHEIRNALYRGEMNKLIHSLSNYESWQKLYSGKTDRFEDQELILRFFALLYHLDGYKGNMSIFLNDFMLQYDDKLTIEKRHELETIFKETVDFIYNSIGENAFIKGKQFNRALYEAVSVGVALAVQAKTKISKSMFENKYEQIINNKDFQKYIQGATNSPSNIINKIILVSKELTL